MRFTCEYPLKPNGISSCLSFIENTLTNLHLGQRDLLESLLLSEEALMLLSEHAPEDANIRVLINQKLGVPRIRLMMPGSPVAIDEHMGTVSLDQLDEEAEQAIRSVMLRSYADSFKYRHSRSGNSLTIITGIPERVLATYTVIAIVLAVISGILFRLFLPDPAIQWIITNLFAPIESLFISALMCITAPAVFVSITCSMFRFAGFSDLGSRGKMVIVCYFLTSVLTTFVGLCVFHVFKPGDAGVLSSLAGGAQTETLSLLEIISTLVPSNVIDPFINVNSLQLMVIALTIGTALTLCGARVSLLKSIFEEVDILCSKVSSLVMQIVPPVVYCSTVNVLLRSHTEVFSSTVAMLLVLLLGIAIVMCLYCILLFTLARLNPFTFLQKYAPTMKNTFLKGSGVAAIPINMRVCRRRLGVPASLCSFSIPLGATINMDGNCVCLTVMSLYFARLCGTSLTFDDLAILLVLVLVLSLGAPIAPGTLILCLVTVLSQMGINTSVISLVIGINFVLEMLLGMVNSVGDVVVALIVAKRSGTLDIDMYNKK